jgi:hypothetical protein
VTGELVYREFVRQQYAWCLERWQKREAGICQAREWTQREERERSQRQETERRECLLKKAANLRYAEDIRALVRVADAQYLNLPESTADDIYGRWRTWRSCRRTGLIHA